MVVLALTDEGKKEPLHFCIEENENISSYKMMLLDLRRRGLKKVDLICSDGFMGIADLTYLFEGCSYQSCYFHFRQSVKQYKDIAKEEQLNFFKDLREIINDSFPLNKSISKLKEVYDKHILIFTRIGWSFNKAKTLISFKKANERFWKTCYTNNPIENLNKHLKRYLKINEQIRKRQRLLDLISFLFLKK